MFNKLKTTDKIEKYIRKTVSYTLKSSDVYSF